MITRDDERVRVYSGEHECSVTLYKPRVSFGNEQISAEVNWSALGASTPETAISYALTIMEAAFAAQAMNAEIK